MPAYARVYTHAYARMHARAQASCMRTSTGQICRRMHGSVWWGYQRMWEQEEAFLSAEDPLKVEGGATNNLHAHAHAQIRAFKPTLQQQYQQHTHTHSCTNSYVHTHSLTHSLCLSVSLSLCLPVSLSPLRARVIATFNRRQSVRNPSDAIVLLLTVDITTTCTQT